MRRSQRAQYGFIKEYLDKDVDIDIVRLDIDM